MPSQSYMRDVVGQLGGANWKRKVEKMADAKVYAIYQKSITQSNSKPKRNKHEDPDIPF